MQKVLAQYRLAVLFVTPFVYLISLFILSLPFIVTPGEYHRPSSPLSDLIEISLTNSFFKLKYLLPFVPTFIFWVMTKANGRIISCFLFTILTLLDYSTYSYLSNSYANTLTVIFFIISLNISQNVLNTTLYSKSWFLSYTLSAVFILLFMFIRAEAFGGAIGIIIGFFVTGLSAINNSKTHTFETIKLVGSLYLIGIPLTILYVYYRSHSKVINDFSRHWFSYRELSTTFDNHESVSMTITSLSGALLYKSMENTTDFSLLPIIQLLSAFLLTIFVPFKTASDEWSMRLTLLKIIGYIFSGIVISNQKRAWSGYVGIIFLFVFCILEIVPRASPYAQFILNHKKF